MIEEKYKPECRDCIYMELKYYLEATLKNNYNPRGCCFCEHPKAKEIFKKKCPKSHRTPAFIAYTKMGGKLPEIKTCPKWCPLKEENW